jgi:hypothetical protein
MRSKFWELIGEGRNRIVYGRGNYVVKVPLNEDGISDNYHERWTWLHRDEGFSYARCRLIGALLIMQYARFPVEGKTDENGWHEYRKDLPWWVDFIDCQQVGYNRFGELVAYDYA